ncbi:hypothetical protein ISU02_21405 [Fusibacter sp. Q10-2]|uniref:Uncharacterized protein n=2 Tax=Fusibacter ferrireducens TaxID=2785058 RepID=A0ABR9ZYX9_9FIRM|nr:hypothetical protein [Fusibacter ferrireducens]
MKTRLNCDLFEGYRCLTRKDKMEKWGAVFREDHFEVETASGLLCAELSQLGDLNESVEPVVWSGSIEITPINSDSSQKFIQPCKFVFYRMNCIQKTEYCTEIHLIVEPAGEVILPESVIREIGEGLLDLIRKKYNKDWIILDSDLNASILRGSF